MDLTNTNVDDCGERERLDCDRRSAEGDDRDDDVAAAAKKEKSMLKRSAVRL
jgi:hypothetical protein